jgi:hypothetical protein
MHLDRRLLGWGVFFVLVGGIPLAVRANLLDREVVAQWPLLWPVLLIGWGVGLLLRGSPIDWVGGAVSAITLGVMGGGLLAAGAGSIPFASGCANDPANGVPFTDRLGQLGSTADVSLTFNCGSLTVDAGDGSAWSLTGADSNGTGPTVKNADSNLVIVPGDAGAFLSANWSTWHLSLPRSTALALDMTLNAGTGSVVLPEATVSSLSMTLNAGKLSLGLATAEQVGDLTATVNAGSGAISLPGGRRQVNLSLNAGSLEVCLPPAAPVLVKWAGALGANNFGEAGLVKLDDSTWTSPGYDASQAHTELHVSANAGSFNLSPGGACNA